jgi:RimJ/RimL family protein N-acetyltransferase
MMTELSDGKIYIRRYQVEDIPALYEAARESAGESFTWWMPWCHADYTLEDSSQFVLSRNEAWQKGKEFDFAIFDVETDTFLGAVGLNQFNREHQFANLGYWVRASSMGQGVAPAATLLVARFAFQDLGLSRIEIVIATENIRSRRVAEKAGAKKEGILRRRLIIGDRIHDAVMYSIVAADLGISLKTID